MANLEKMLQERDGTIALERRDTFLEVQHLEESFSNMCFFLLLAGLGSDLSSLLFFF